MKVMLALLGTTLLIGRGVASADPVTVDFTGTIQSVDPALGTTVTDGQLITGSFTYNPAAAALSGDATGAQFDALQGVSVHVGSLAEQISGSSSIVTAHNSMDVFQVLADSTLNVSSVFKGGTLSGFSANDFILNDVAPYGALFSDARHLPASLSGVSAAESGSSFIQLGFADPALGSDVFILASLSTLTTAGSQSVPEPGLLELLALGAGGLFLSLRRQRRGNGHPRLTTTGVGSG